MWVGFGNLTQSTKLLVLAWVIITLRCQRFMDNLTRTLCEQIKLATAEDIHHQELIENAFIALTKMIEIYPKLNTHQEVQNQYKLLLKELFFYLVYQGNKISDDMKNSKVVKNIFKIESNTFLKNINKKIKK